MTQQSLFGASVKRELTSLVCQSLLLLCIVYSFDQFCINYCNERIQQFFIDSVLRTEQEVYMNEGLDWTEVGFTSNERTCRLIEVRLHACTRGVPSNL